MIKTIEYIFPGGKESEEAFAALKLLLLGSNAKAENDRLIISSPGLNPVTVFRLDPTAQEPQIIFSDGKSQTQLPPSFFAKDKPKIEGTSLSEAAKLLTGNITHVDCTGIVVRPQNIIAEFWTTTVDLLAASLNLRDYPASAEYKPEGKARWLYAIPQARWEHALPASISKVLSRIMPRRRQPKFELVCDPTVPFDGTILHIAVDTNLTIAEIAKIPGTYAIPDLEDFFRSMKFPSPWPGISGIRLDLRPKGAKKAPLSEWITGNFFGQRVRPGRGEQRHPPRLAA